MHRLPSGRLMLARLGRRSDGLWHNPAFMRFWAADSISQFGIQVSAVALPLAAALLLGASAGQMGMLSAAATAPFLLIGLFVGVWVDRVRRRPLLVLSDLARAAILLAVPLAWALDALSMGLLYGVAFLVGTFTVVFEVAFASYLPTLVRREELVEGNGKIAASASAAQVGGPGIAGILVSLLGAPVAVLIDAASYLVSAALMWKIPALERRPTPSGGEQRVRREIGEGLRAVFHSPVLRALIACSATSTLFGYVFLAVYILYLTEDLGLGPTAVGLVFATGGVGAVLGAVIARSAARRFRPGPTMVAAQVLCGLGGMAIPLAVAVPTIALPLVLVAEFFQWMMLVTYTVNGVSLRQALTPDRLQGRVNATARFVISGAQPVGALLGGALGEAVGVRPTLIVGVLGMLAASLWVLLSPVRGIRVQPAGLPEEPRLPALAD